MEQSLALYEALGDERGRASARASLGKVLATLGDVPTALAYLADDLVVSRRTGARWQLAHGLCWLGYCHFVLGDLDAARADLTESVALFRELSDPEHAAYSLRLLSYVALAQGDTTEAWRLVEESLTANTLAGDRPGVAYCGIALAGILTACGQPQRAAQLAGASVAALERLGHDINDVVPTERIQHEAMLASLRASLGEAAFDAAWSAGRARPLDELLAGVLAPSPPEQPHSAPTLPDGLTPREVEVLGLLAAGLSNREIAGRLVVSVRTVGRHVDNIYGKIGVHERSKARQYARDHGLIATPSPTRV